MYSLNFFNIDSMLWPFVSFYIDIRTTSSNHCVFFFKCTNKSNKKYCWTPIVKFLTQNWIPYRLFRLVVWSFTAIYTNSFYMPYIRRIDVYIREQWTFLYPFELSKLKFIVCLIYVYTFMYDSQFFKQTIIFAFFYFAQTIFSG